MKKISLKTYRIINLVIVIVLAVIFSQLFLYKNYLLALPLVVIFSLVMFWLRRQVKEIVADERDYVIGGKAALLTMQIWSWCTVIVMIILLAFSDTNPVYESIAITLSFTVCSFMLLYSVIFRYYNKINFKDKNFIFSALVLLFFLVIFLIAGVRLFTQTNNWVCKNGQWVKHGNPSVEMPKTECE